MLAIARALMLRPRLMLLDEPSLGLAPKLTRELFEILERIAREEGVDAAAGRAERQPRPGVRRRRARARGRPDRALGHGGRDPGGRGDPPLLPGVVRRAVERFIQVIIDGLATGSIYGALALAVVLIYRSTGIVNFAQGEMAMFSTFIAWGLVAGGAAARARAARHARDLVRRRDADRAGDDPAGRGRRGAHARDRHARALHPRQQPRRLDLGLRATAASRACSRTARVDVGGRRASPSSRSGIVAVLLARGRHAVADLPAHEDRASRCAPRRSNPDSSRLVGIPVGRMLMIGWGWPRCCGALAGVLVAPRLFLDANLMGRVIIYSFAAATLGGFDSPVRRGARRLDHRRRRGARRRLRRLHRPGPEDPRAAGRDPRACCWCARTGCSARPRWRGHERAADALPRGASCSSLAVAAAVLLQLLPRRRSSRCVLALRGRRARAQPAASATAARSRSATARSSRSAPT